MKSHQIIFRIIILFLLIAGSNLPGKAQTFENEEPGFNYVISGKVQDGDNVKISLYIPSQSMEKRQTLTVRYGEYIFTGRVSNPEAAEIKIEKSIVRFKGASCEIPVFIEKDAVTVNFKIEKDAYAWYCFKDIEYLQGENNLYYSNTKDEFAKTNPEAVYTDEHRLDSMQTYVYPAAKTKILDSYEKLYYLNEHQIVSLSMLDNIVSDNFVFDKEHLTDTEKKRLTLFLDGIDKSVHNTKAYRFAEDRIGHLISESGDDTQ